MSSFLDFDDDERAVADLDLYSSLAFGASLESSDDDSSLVTVLHDDDLLKKDFPSACLLFVTREFLVGGFLLPSAFSELLTERFLNARFILGSVIFSCVASNGKN